MATSSYFPLLFLSYLLIITSSTTTTAKPNDLTTTVTKPSNSKPATSFIRSSCRATRYPAVCYHYLSPLADKIQRSERQLALTALAVSVTQARSASQFVSKMSKSKGMKMKHREFEALKDCVDTVTDSVDQLSRSFKELGHMGRASNGEDFMFRMSNVQTWVSAALTDQNTCIDGFSGRLMSGSKIKGVISMRLTNVAQVTSNALALVNRFAYRH